MLLITGVTGHTGRYFLQHLIDNQYNGKIRCVVRENSNIKLLENSGLDFELAVGDLDDSSFVNEIMKDITTIMHIYNIHHSPVIIEAAIKNQVSRAILVHTTGIYSQFKSASEEYIRIESEVLSKAKDKIDLTILRPTMIYGDMCDYNMSKFIKMIDSMRIYPLIDNGKGLIQPVNARDLGKAYYDVLVNPASTANKQYDLSGHQPISVKEALTIISDKLTKRTMFVNIPMQIGVLAAKTIKILSLGKIDVVEQVLRMGEDRAYSHDLAKSDFNFSPMPFGDGIAEEIAEFKQSK
ncbi:SDR family oxidoreductase [Bacillus sp. T33-2]|uniref:SDR family oxidoreductase n=1 Tax=Bacillus sp. T33-2 TaxID=2054168 RepID=UPI000C7854F0|nr:NAD-dependent epimerase/dehydratase family protein [Bacillus sp. T33-2]PLR91234.1 hypothetical protein CVD19_21835 [Bacillus sp. T33-2]